VDLEVAGVYKGAFDCIIVSVRVHGRDRVGAKEDNILVWSIENSYLFQNSEF